MIFAIVTFIFLIIETMLATFVALHAWNHRPARWFVFLVASIALLNISSFARHWAADERSVYISLVSIILLLIVFETLMLVLLSTLFVPQWWQGSRPIIWISLPYIIVFIVTAIDLVGGIGLFIAGITRTDNNYRLLLVYPGADILSGLFFLSLLVHLGILLVAFARQPDTRRTISLLLVSLIVSIIMSYFARSMSIVGALTLPTSTVLLLIALAYAVLRTRLLVPIQVALDLALQAMDEAVTVLDEQGHVVYANARAREWGLDEDQSVITALAAIGTGIDSMRDGLSATTTALSTWKQVGTLTLNQRRVTLTTSAVIDHRGTPQGVLLMGRDITETEQYTQQLEQEQQRLALTVRQLEAEKHERSQLEAVVRQLSLPLIPVIEGVVVLPLIGNFDQERAEDFTQVLLGGIQQYRAHLVLIDITGILMLDTTSATALLRGIQGAALLGTRCMLVGIRPEIAEALVALGLPLDTFATAATLAQGLQQELRQLHPEASTPSQRNSRRNG